MNLNLVELQKQWKKLIENQKPQLDLFFWKQYLKPSYVSKVKEHFVEITTPSPLAINQLKQEGVDKLFCKTLNVDLTVRFVSLTNTAAISPTATTPAPVKSKTFVVGTFNKAAYEITQEIIQRKNKWGIIFIYSEPGLGKTHLLKSIVRCCAQNVIYKHANDFGSEVVGILQGDKQTQEYKEKFTNKDAILFDDIQILSERKKTNEVLFQIINSAQEKEDVDLVFTSDQHPEDLFGFDRRLRSRFLSGLVIKIDYPDLDNAKEITLAKMQSLLPNYENIDDKVFNLISKTYRKDIRKIEGAIKQLVFFIKQNPHTKIENKDLKQIFSDSKLNDVSQISIKKIKGVVARHSGITLLSLNSNSRKREIVEARYVAMYLIRLLTNESHASIAKSFKANNHSTAVNAIKKIREKMKKHPEYEKEVLLIKEKCLND